MSILVIGGKGLIGIHASRRFLREGYPVVMYDVYPGDVSHFFDRGNAPVYIKGDVMDLDHLLKVIDQYRVEGMIHASLGYATADALKNTHGSFEDIVEGTLQILEAARTKKLRLVCVSTQAVYGASSPLNPVKEDSPLNPSNIYSCWKAMSDLMCLTYQKVFQVDLAVIRTSYVYGPVLGPHRRKRLDLPEAWLRKALTNETVEISEGADHLMDWTYAEDVAQGIFLAYSVRPIKHRIFNISKGRNVPLKELAQTVMDLVPGSSIKLGPGSSETLIKTLVPPMRGPGDIALAREELGYEPQFTIQKGLSELLSWIKKEGLLPRKE